EGAARRLTGHGDPRNNTAPSDTARTSTERMSAMSTAVVPEGVAVCPGAADQVATLTSAPTSSVTYIAYSTVSAYRSPSSYRHSISTRVPHCSSTRRMLATSGDGVTRSSSTAMLAGSGALAASSPGTTRA